MTTCSSRQIDHDKLKHEVFEENGKYSTVYFLRDHYFVDKSELCVNLLMKTICIMHTAITYKHERSKSTINNLVLRVLR